MRGLMIRCALGSILCMALAGCLSTASGPVAGTRDQSVPMSSLASFDPAQFSGRWYEVEAYVPDGASCVLGAVTFSRQKNGDMILSEGPCSDGNLRRGVATRIGPGRFNFAGDELWVLWVDQSYDVAVIATPTGKAHVLSRALEIPRDKRKAARDILTWNGFDVSTLRPARRR
ncbi:lipocalin family protein [Pacificibacter marinus]|uniref:Lipocalin-like domain protein n=1 Tax=Pacificibacter marinus TaxID=658057 RepID=A0A1Y5SW92_9RHOB|nr:lipocalin family protein [Pacificibacter marinus]SEK66921.1 apolipoprotein D and lipocalin family protein [Pacificibacter marinus]SLN46593.1 Lipocalin-like domain protein [Pacificibacter marinus]